MVLILKFLKSNTFVVILQYYIPSATSFNLVNFEIFSLAREIKTIQHFNLFNLIVIR